MTCKPRQWFQSLYMVCSTQKTYKAVFVLLLLFFRAVLDSFQRQQNTLCYYIYLEVQTYLKCLAFMDIRPCVVGWSTPTVPKGRLAQDGWIRKKKKKKKPGWSSEMKFLFFVFTHTRKLILRTLYEPQTFVNPQLFLKFLKSSNGFLFDFNEYDRM